MSDLPTWSTVGERLRALREAGGVSQRELAVRADVPQAQVSRMETGASEPGVLTTARVCQALGLSVSDLLSPSEWRQRMYVIAAQRLHVGHDDDGQPVGVRRDDMLPGGPHSVFCGERAHALAQVEVAQRAHVGLRTVVLGRDVRWRDPRVLATLGTRLRSVQDARCATGTTVVGLGSMPDETQATVDLLGRLAAGGDVLLVVDEAAVAFQPAVRDVVDGVMREGRRTRAAVNLVCVNEPPTWSLPNAAQVLRAGVAQTSLSWQGSTRQIRT